MRWRIPALVGSEGVVPGIVGDEGRDAEFKVRWHSLRTPGREDAGRTAGREMAWIELNNLVAKGRVEVGAGTPMGWMLGYDLGDSGVVERWWMSVKGVRAERKDADARQC